LFVYPNPVQDVSKISLQLPSGQTVQLKLLDATGKLIGTKKLTLNRGVNLIIWEVINKISKGSYWIQAITDNGASVISKFVK